MNSHFPHQSITLSMMISHAVYRAVVGIERLVRLSRRVFRAGK